MEGFGGGEIGIRVDVGDGDGEGVEVFFGLDEEFGGSDDGIVSVEFLDDLVGKLEFCVGVGFGEENVGGLIG